VRGLFAFVLDFIWKIMDNECTHSSQMERVYVEHYISIKSNESFSLFLHFLEFQILF
jgi:hypothetical protein